MKVELRMIGKTNFDYLNEGMQLYEKRLKHYLSFESQVIPDIKNPKSLDADQIKQKEGALILQKLQKEDCLLLLDEKGKEFTSVAFAGYLEKLFYSSKKRIVFQIGGAFGFSQEVYDRADGKLALSKMTFSHQMVRLFFLEQLYRAMTIIKGEPYHNQ